MHKLIAPAAVAAALIAAALAVPTAAQAATTTPEIGAVFSNGNHASVHDGAARMESAPRMGLGSATGETGFANTRVVVRDAQGREVCDTDDNGYESDGGWECNATPSTLPVGTHTVHAVAYDADGEASAESDPVRLTITGDADTGDDSTAQPVEGGVDGGFTAPGATAQPAPGGVDAGFTAPGNGAVAQPDVTVRNVGVSSVIGVTTAAYQFVEVRDAAGSALAEERRSDGYLTMMVPTPAAGQSAIYTVHVRNDDHQEATPVAVTVDGPASGAEGVVSQPAPGGVDAGFTHPGADDGVAFGAPTADWAYIRMIGGQQTVIAALQTRAGATVVVTESNGTVHRYTADDSGRVDVSMPWQGNSSPQFTAVAHDGDDVSATATIMPTRG